LYEQIASNRRRTAFLIFGSFVLLVGIGYLFGLLLSAGIVGAAIAFAIAVVMAIVSYRKGDKIVLRSARAKPVTKEEQPRLHNIVEGLCIAAGLPKPAVYVVPEQAPNAFATGRDPEHSSIAVTQGLLDTMNRVELEGVIAHELSHVKDRDILVGTIAATFAGAVVLMAEFMLRWFFWGGGIRRRGGSREGGSGFLILAVLGILLAILAPIFAQLIQLAISRRREYLADAQGAMLTRYPPGLASALKKIAATPIPMRAANNATAHLFISQPSRTPGEGLHWWEKLLATHPPIQDRIRILEEM